MRKIKIILTVFATLVLMAQSSVVFAINNLNTLSALDTVANFETVIKANSVPAGTKVIFNVTKPDLKMASVSTFADSSGNASAVFPDTETKLAGTYNVRTNLNLGETSFQVFPGDLSKSRSLLSVSKDFAAADTVDFSKVEVHIADEFGNPLSSHEIKLVSNRSEDKITAIAPYTDDKGNATFYVSSSAAGVSILIATDESEDVTFDSRAKVVFFRSSKSVYKAIGGDPDLVLLAAVTPVARFEIENMPATANVNGTISFTVKAVDASGVLVNSYTGQIVFIPTDAAAQFPSPYTFQASDQGRKTFDLGLTFKTAGTQKLLVHEKDNGSIKGEKTIEVLSAPGGGAGQVRITKPATGTYSSKTLAIEGEVSPNARVTIFDNGQQIAEVTANSSGRFAYTTPLLTDGQHVFHVGSSGVQSTPVTVTIDTTPAQISEVNIEKQELGPGETTGISIRSDADVSSIQVTVGDIIVDLTADSQNSGIFSGVLTAPANTGEYPINAILTDKQGNVAPAKEVGKLTVSSDFTNNNASFSAPSKIQSVTAAAGNGKVT
ncbi:MAG: Ig-like domain-containing protein, partial [Candidatus Gracilibacteria bacterium]